MSYNYKQMETLRPHWSLLLLLL